MAEQQLLATPPFIRISNAPVCIFQPPLLHNPADDRLITCISEKTCRRVFDCFVSSACPVTFEGCAIFLGSQSGEARRRPTTQICATNLAGFIVHGSSQALKCNVNVAHDTRESSAVVAGSVASQ